MEIKTVLEDLFDCVKLWEMAVFHSDLNCSLNIASGTSVCGEWRWSISSSSMLVFRHHTEHLLHAQFICSHLLQPRKFSHNKVFQAQKFWDCQIILRTSSARMKCSLFIALTHYSHQLPNQGSKARGVKEAERAAVALFYADSVEWVKYKIVVSLFFK